MDAVPVQPPKSSIGDLRRRAQTAIDVMSHGNPHRALIIDLMGAVLTLAQERLDRQNGATVAPAELAS
jgi:hypothetical protein